MSRIIPKQILDFDANILDIDEQTKINCDSPVCRDRIAPSLSITRVDDELGPGLLFHCYRDGCDREGRRFDNRTPKQAIEYMKNRRRTHKSNLLKEVHLPKDFTPMAHNYNTIPAKAYAWLYQYELDKFDIYRFNIGYSKSLNGVVFPIYKNNTLIGFQSRNLDYSYNKEIRELKYYTESMIKQIYYLINNNNYKYLFITEDIISSIKINKLHYNTLALLTTKIHTSLMEYLKKYQKIILWLDYNAKVQSLKQVNKLRSIGYNISSKITFKDPKEISLKDMRGMFI